MTWIFLFYFYFLLLPIMKWWSFCISFYSTVKFCSEFHMVRVVFIPAPNGFIEFLRPIKLPYAMLRECMKQFLDVLWVKTCNTEIILHRECHHMVLSYES